MAGVPKPTTVSTKQARIAMLAKQMPGTALHSLSHHVDLEWLRGAFRRTRKDGAVGLLDVVHGEPPALETGRPPERRKECRDQAVRSGRLRSAAARYSGSETRRYASSVPSIRTSFWSSRRAPS